MCSRERADWVGGLSQTLLRRGLEVQGGAVERERILGAKESRKRQAAQKANSSTRLR